MNLEVSFKLPVMSSRAAAGMALRFFSRACSEVCPAALAVPITGPDEAPGVTWKAADIDIRDSMGSEKLSFPVFGQLRNTICAGSSRAGRHQFPGPCSAERRRIGTSQGGKPFPGTRSVNDFSLQDTMQGAAIAASAERPKRKIGDDPSWFEPGRTKAVHVKVS